MDSSSSFASRFPSRGVARVLAMLFACLLISTLGLSSVIPTVRAQDVQVPMPPAGGWPSFPRAVTRVSIPSACGTTLHNLWCRQDARLERALEQEFWLLVGNLTAPTDPSVAGLKDWVGRVGSYIGYTSRYTGLPTPLRWYGGFAGGPEENRGRLTMLLAAANTALFRAYDLEVLVDAVQKVDILSLIKNASQLPALYHLLESLKYADEAAYLIPSHQNSRAFAFGLGAFAQWALPIAGIDLGKVVPNVRGGLGLRYSYPLGLEGGKSTVLKLMDPSAPCDSPDECRELAGTEGVFAGATTMLLLDPSAIPTRSWAGLEHYGSLVEAGIDIMYDPVAGDCGTYACSITSTIAPFKKIGGLMLLSTAYGRIGDVAQMRAVFAQIRELALQQEWPFVASLDDMEARVEGTGAHAGNGLLTQWQRDQKRLGFVQLPLPPATGIASCAGCHFAGQMPNPNVYER